MRCRHTRGGQKSRSSVFLKRSLLTPLIFRCMSLNLDLVDSARLTAQPVPGILLRLPPLCLCPSAAVTSDKHKLHFCVHAGDLSSGPGACTESLLPTEPTTDLPRSEPDFSPAHLFSGDRGAPRLQEKRKAAIHRAREWLQAQRKQKAEPSQLKGCVRELPAVSPPSFFTSSLFFLFLLILSIPFPSLKSGQATSYGEHWKKRANLTGCQCLGFGDLFCSHSPLYFTMIQIFTQCTGSDTHMHRSRKCI